MVAGRRYPALFRYGLCIATITVLHALPGCFVSAAATDAELCLRIAWGGGTAARWQGSISLDDGTLVEITSLGIDQDAQHSFLLSDNITQLSAPRPRTYEAVDVTLRAPLNANVIVELSHTGMTKQRTISIPISKLIAGRHTEPLDEQGNRLLIRRAPGDALRVDIQRDHLVFAPNEPWSIRISPHLLGSSFRGSAAIAARLLKGRTDHAIWSTQQELSINKTGTVDRAAELQIPVPEMEGVYDLELQVVRSRTRSLLPSTETVVSRRVQFVVVDNKEPTHDNQDGWTEVLGFDPVQPNWKKRLASISPWNALKPGQPRSFGSGDATIWKREAKSWTRLSPDGWQAYALPIDTPGEPHTLEIEYPGEIPQTLGISVIEPNSAGKVVPVGVDTAIHVEASQTVPVEPQRYRLIFWPRTELPYLLLTNRQSKRSATYGEIRLFHRSELPIVPIERTQAEHRMAIAQFSRPLFCEVFGASDAVDPETGQALDDWLTFYEGASRLIEFAKYLGYDAISLAALCEGSAIYPVDGIQPTPKYDTGAYFTNGQDPVRKDVLEMLFRMCDRAGLKLIPSLELSAPISSLQATLRGDASESIGIRLVNALGQPRTRSATGQVNVSTIYNPLDQRVQTALVGLVDQLASRYGGHASFGGVGVALARGTSSYLPGLQWASDPVTLAEFAREADLVVDHRGRVTTDHVRLLSNQTYRDEWLAWRSRRLAGMYQRMAQVVRQSQPDARLYLAMTDLTTEPAVADALNPGLPRVDKLPAAFSELGIDPTLYDEQAGLSLLRPHRFDPLKTLIARRSDYELNAAQETDRWFESSNIRGSSFFHAPRPKRLADVDAASPFGQQNTYTLLTPQVVPAGPACRRHIVHSLASRDLNTWLDGGWTALRDQHGWFAPILDIFRRLPAESFETVQVPTNLGTRMVMRTLAKDGVTYAYVVNDSPWPIEARVQLDVPAACELQPLTPFRQPGRLEVTNDGVWWTFQMQPYDVLAGVLTSTDVRVLAIRNELPNHVLPGLRIQIAELSARVQQLTAPRPMPVAVNSGFEMPQPLQGWTSTRVAEVEVTADQRVHHNGAQSLRVISKAPLAWVRSEPFTTPQTGQLLLRVWMKQKPQTARARVRLLVESENSDESFSRQLDIPAQQESSVTDSGWHSHEFWIDDLPVDSVSDLRVGMDILGPGTVWFDDIELFDLAFTRSERNELGKIIALADLQLREGRMGDCQTTLERYWLRYLLSYVPPDKSRVARARAKRDKAAAPLKAPPPRRTSRFWDRMRRLVPTIR
jgi:hypothetical protein